MAMNEGGKTINSSMGEKEYNGASDSQKTVRPAGGSQRTVTSSEEADSQRTIRPTGGSQRTVTSSEEADSQRTIRPTGGSQRTVTSSEEADSQRTIRPTDNSQKTLRSSSNENTGQSSRQENASGNSDQGFSVDDILSIFNEQFNGKSLFGSFQNPPSEKSQATCKIALHLRVKVNLTLEEVAAGTRKTVRYKRKKICHRCDGKGFSDGMISIPCSTCGGKGFIWEEQGLGGTLSTILGTVTVNPHPVKKNCPDCKGQGVLNVDFCPLCDGEGYISEEDTVSFDIPAGLLNGQELVIKGKGNMIGSETGDLYIIIEKISEHPTFQRDGYNLIYKIHLSDKCKACGTPVQVPLLDGTVQIVEPILGADSTVLPGLGLPIYGSGKRGDLIVKWM